MTPNNNWVRQLILLLTTPAIEKQYELVFETVKVRTRTTRYRYPDLAMSCDPGQDDYIIENPYFIAEGLSGSSEITDIGKELEEYTHLSSLESYILISHNSRFVIVYKREGTKWLVEPLDETGQFDVPCLGITIDLSQCYTGIL